MTLDHKTRYNESMKKINTSPLSGMQEFLPSTQAKFNEYKHKIEEVYHAHGFLSIETPTIDRTEILLAKAGGDTEKQIYKVVKTEESASDADQALRFDHTVPLARYVVEHENELAFPFKATQIGKNFRGERAQKGRFREFYQCDVDVIGRGELPISYDAEVIATIYEALKSFVDTQIKIRISNRKVIAGILAGLGISDKLAETCSIIDHSEKVPAEKTEAAFREIGLSDADLAKMLQLLNTHGSYDEVAKSLKSLGDSVWQNGTFITGLHELEKVMIELDALGVDNATIDLRIIRGLDYYTGTVFEANLPDYPKVGSVSGGGRYENLTGHFTDAKFPGVGASIGLSRLFYALSETGLVAQTQKPPIDIAILPVSENENLPAFELAKKLRQKGQTVDVVLTEKRLGDRLSYAAKLARGGIVIGETEAQSGQYTVRDFATRSETPLEI